MTKITKPIRIFVPWISWRDWNEARPHLAPCALQTNWRALGDEMFRSADEHGFEPEWVRLRPEDLRAAARRTRGALSAADILRLAADAGLRRAPAAAEWPRPAPVAAMAS